MMIFLAAWLLGGKKAAPAAGLGACLADLALGYAAWMAPTFIIKFLAVAMLLPDRRKRPCTAACWATA